MTLVGDELKLFPSDLRCNLDGAIGGTYQLPDGREFWMDAAAVRAVLARIEPVIMSWLETRPTLTADDLGMSGKNEQNLDLAKYASEFDEEALMMLMLNELHSNMPEIDRPMSLSDLSDAQAERARKAVRAVIVGACLSKPAGRHASIAEAEASFAADDDVLEVELSDRSIQIAEEAYDNFVRAEGYRSPYLNTRAFRAAFRAVLTALGYDRDG